MPLEVSGLRGWPGWGDGTSQTQVRRTSRAGGRHAAAAASRADPDGGSDDMSAPRKRASRALRRLRRLFYWCAVLGLWALIVAGGAVVWVAANLPPIHSLEIPRRPPSIEIVGTDGKSARDARRDARRHADAEGDAALSAEGVPRDRGSPLLQSLRRRSDRPRARRRRQPEPPRRIAGRLDHSPSSSPRTCS